MLISKGIGFFNATDKRCVKISYKSLLTYILLVSSTLFLCSACQTQVDKNTNLTIHTVDSENTDDKTTLNSESDHTSSSPTITVDHRTVVAGLAFDDNTKHAVSSRHSAKDLTKPSTTFDSASNKQYLMYCSACHGQTGLGALSYPALVGCAHCEDASSLASYIERNMPLGAPESCTGDCAKDIAHYLVEVVNGEKLQESKISGFDLETPEQTFRRAALVLAGRMPTNNEFDQLRVAGDKESALSQLIDKLFREENYATLIGEVFNDVLLTDKFLSVHGDFTAALDKVSQPDFVRNKRIGQFKSEDYPSARWYKKYVTEHTEKDYFIQQRVNDSLAREVVELVKYVVMQQRPLSEILTADYVMVNWYSAQVYGVKNMPRFKRLTTPRYTDFPYDPSDYQPVKITSNPHAQPRVPHAGLLSSSVFLHRYPTSKTNRNRHRSRVIYDYFLDTNILAIGGGRPADTSDINNDHPTMTNPNCTVCHNILDPVASTFHNWSETGLYRPSVWRDKEYEGDYSVWESRHIQPAGLAGIQMPKKYTDNSLQWLGQRISEDPRFSRAMVRIFYRALFGQEPLRQPRDHSDKAKQEFYTQRNTLSKLETNFRRNAYNTNQLVKSFIMSDLWRAQHAQNNEQAQTHHDIGAVRLIPPEVLRRKTQALLGVTWDELDHSQRESLQKMVLLYGGIDSKSVTERLQSPNGLVAAIQRRFAIEMACMSTAQDLAKPQSERLLFKYVDLNTLPSASQSQKAIKRNIQHMHWHLLGERLSIDSAEVEHTYKLFAQIHEAGMRLPMSKRRLPYACRSTVVTGGENYELDDPQYVVSSWIAVMTYLLSDFRYTFY